MVVCEFDKLFTKCVPHILEKIFFSVDYKSFKNCARVCRSWNDLLTSESLRRISKSVFFEDILDELMQAAGEGNTDMARSILSSGMVNANHLTMWGILHEAAWHGHKDVVKLFLYIVDPDQIFWYKGNYQSTPLLFAASKGFTDVVKVLLDKGADPNEALQNGRTPLHYAASKGHQYVVKLLLERGAAQNMADESGRTPLDEAAWGGHHQVVVKLLECPQSKFEQNLALAYLAMTPTPGTQPTTRFNILLLLMCTSLSLICLILVSFPVWIALKGHT